ncbi:hypothetical protein BDA99DRAFT_432095 [Phascolomyces articulosus]|uniref:Uncharacterized protein n=1 Tax=Phascolomyces articulosus TaxID=60185 RepID=A0AAD5K8W5_9FUNG|nr:hypothetical protein BDA99DRAFT_432095 [Phascolomyces articulosus]
MDPQDNCWTEYFSTEELQEIKNHKKVVLDPIPDDLREYLYSYSGKHDVEGLFQHNIKKLYHPITQPDLHWAQKIIMEALDLYFYKYLPIDDHTEADLIHRVWHFIEKCYDESKIVVRSGEKVSNASSNRINGDRFVKGTEKMKKMEIGHKVDLLFTHEKQEFGCGEAGLKGDKNGMKAMIESNLKLPRLLKDMLCELVYESPSKIRDTKVAGFIISGLNLTLIVMDSPAGCLTRVSKIGPLAYPTTPEVFAKKMIPLLMLTWQVKSLMKESVRLICFDDTVEEPSFDASPSCPIPPCISSPKGRKRKLGDLDD